MNNQEKMERLIEATVALLESAPSQRLQVTNLNKALFYLDLVALRDTGETLTRCRYVALEQGPVVDGYRDKLIPALVKKGLAHQDEVGKEKPVVLTRAIDSYRFMDDHLRAAAAQVAGYVAGKSAAGISRTSHGNPGWQIAYEHGSGINASPKPINMLVAMQQIMDTDPWMAAPPDEECEAAFQEATKARGMGDPF